MPSNSHLLPILQLVLVLQIFSGYSRGKRLKSDIFVEALVVPHGNGLHKMIRDVGSGLLGSDDSHFVRNSHGTQRHCASVRPLDKKGLKTAGAFF